MALGRKPLEIVNDGKHQLLVKSENWERIFLGEIAKVQNGFPFNSKKFVKDKGIPLIRIRDIDKTTTVDRYDGEYSSEFIIKRGDFLIGMDGDFKAAIWKGENALLNQRVCRIIPTSNSFDSKFLFLCLQPYLNAINEETSSVTVKHLSSKTIEEIPLPYPRIEEQKAIVSKIEELFSELDKGIEQLKTALQQLKTYRQAVLKWAFEGRLTNKDVKDGALPPGWKIVKFGEIHEIKSNLVSALDYLDLPHIAPDNISKGTAKLLSYKTIREDKVFSPKHKFYKGQIIYSKIRPNLSKVIIAPIDGLCSADMYPIDSNLDNQFTLYYMLSNYFVSKASNTESRTVLPKINQKGLNEIPFPLCSIDEQKMIVQEIESRLSVADKMEETINQSLQQAEALRQSILKKAFEGKLVATDTIETIKETAKVIPLARKVLAGKIIHLLHDDKHFGLTKFQKILYLVENYAEVPYETNFIQDRAGPHDKEFTTAFRKEMQENDWLQEEQKGKITKFILGDNIGSLIKDYAVYFRNKGKEIVFVIKLLKDKSTHEAELIATLYAVWNNRLIKKKPVKIDLLIEDFFNWSPKKKEEFQPEEVVATFKWMKKTEFVPKGFGKVIGTN